MVKDLVIGKQQLIATSKFLGSLLRSKPSSPDLQPFFDLLENDDLSLHWPTGTPEELQEIQNKLRSHPVNKDLDLLWQEMMIGPNHLEAPPWGSVYLDREQVIFGDSCIELAFFLKSIGMELHTGQHEPEDHIGLMFWYVAALLEKEEDAQLAILLKDHLLPWAYRYTELFFANAPDPFFEGLALLTSSVLHALQGYCQVTPAIKKLYF